MARKPPRRTEFRYDLRPSEIFEQVYEWNPNWYASDKDGSSIIARGDQVAAEPDAYNIHALNIFGALRISGWVGNDQNRWMGMLDLIQKKTTELLPVSRQNRTSAEAWQVSDFIEWQNQDGRTKQDVIDMLKWAEGELEKYLKYLEENQDDDDC